MTHERSRRNAAVLDSLEPFYRFISESAYARLDKSADVADFVVGNPHELPLPDYTYGKTLLTPGQRRGVRARRPDRLRLLRA